MYRGKNIAIDHGNRNMKTENLIFTSGRLSVKQPPFGVYAELPGENIMHPQGRSSLPER